ncbi:unnamed protein product [Lupinus luteus]|uniref:Uncharacterized protein n=1 Tax=Lupinus luteus TaxID=3873 RepID=A0AAV1Y0U9_LUPLU
MDEPSHSFLLSGCFPLLDEPQKAMLGALVTDDKIRRVVYCIGYNSLSNDSLPDVVWDWKGPLHINFLLWRLIGNSLPINSLRFKRHLTLIACCPRCCHEENTIHAFRDCDFVKAVWNSIIPSSASASFFCIDLKDWCTSNLTSSLLHFGNVHWSLVFGIAIDAIWRCRNKLIFDNEETTCRSLCAEIEARSKCTVDAFQQQVNSSGPSALPLSGPICWFPPYLDWIKLNTGGAFSPVKLLAGCGGVVRDHFGAFVFNFANKIGLCSIIQAELWGILLGLRLLLQRGFLKVCLETDSASSLHLLRSGCAPPHPCASLVNQIRLLIPQFLHFHCSHIFLGLLSLL